MKLKNEMNQKSKSTDFVEEKGVTKTLLKGMVFMMSKEKKDDLNQ